MQLCGDEALKVNNKNSVIVEVLLLLSWYFLPNLNNIK